MTETQSSIGSRWTIVIAVLVGLGIIAYLTTFPRDRSDDPTTTDLQAENMEHSDEGEAVALVNGVAISRGELNIRLAQFSEVTPEMLGTEENAELIQNVLDGMIAEELLFQKAEAEGITPDHELISEQIEETRQELGEEEFQERLALSGSTEEEMYNLMARLMIIQEFMLQEVPEDMVQVSDEEVEEELRALMAQVEDPDEIDTEEIREIVREQIVQQKHEELIMALVDQLRSEGDVQILL